MKESPATARRRWRAAVAAAVALVTGVVVWTQAGPASADASGRLVGAGSGRCLDVTGVSQAAGAKVQIWDCNGQANQTWHYTAAGELRVYNDTMCLDAYGRGTANGTKVVIWNCNGQTNQQWRQNANGSFTGVQSGRCLDVT